MMTVVLVSACVILGIGVLVYIVHSCISTYPEGDE